MPEMCVARDVCCQRCVLPEICDGGRERGLGLGAGRETEQAAIFGDHIIICQHNRVRSPRLHHGLLTLCPAP